MCGIISVIAKNTTYTQAKIFEELMYVGALRGFHSVGAFTKEGFAKDAVLPTDFVNNKKYQDLVTKFKATPNGKGNFLISHNRFATQGAINGKNAHPFKCGNITGVHNGSLTTMSNLPDHHNFEVDSHNIFHSINKIGVKETIEKLQGAFTLVWYDASDNTIHMIRNSQRPYFLQQAGGVWYGASEEAMLKWILKRNKVTYYERDGFELEVGIEYIFDVEEGDLITRHKRKFYVAPSVPKPPATTTTNTKGGGTTSIPSTTTTSPSSASSSKLPAKCVTDKKVEDIIPWGSRSSGYCLTEKSLKDAGHDLKKGDFIEIMINGIIPTGSYTKAEGYCINTLEDVYCYNIDPKKIEEWKVYKGQITSAYVDKDSDLKIIVNSDTLEYLRDTETLEGASSDDPDTVWGKCSWCSAEIMESEKAEVEKECEGFGYELCLDCIDSMHKWTV